MPSDAPVIRFYLDFVSTYSYFAAMRIDAMAASHGVAVDWRVVSLPHVFKAAGTVSPLDQPLKLAHNRRDTERVAAQMGLPFTRPPVPPDVQPARLLFHHLRSRDPGLAAGFAKAAMAVRFGEGLQLSGEGLDRACAVAGIDGSLARAAADDPAARESLVALTDAAVREDGMFGAPFAVLGGERFWGHDRVLDQLDWWLRQRAPARPAS